MHVSRRVLWGITLPWRKGSFSTLQGKPEAGLSSQQWRKTVAQRWKKGMAHGQGLEPERGEDATGGVSRPR